jgi:hypothetical protein
VPFTVWKIVSSFHHTILCVLTIMLWHVARWFTAVW